MKIATCTQCGWTGDASLCDNGEFEPPSCAMCERSVMIGPEGAWKSAHRCPKPVGVSLYIKRKGVITQETHFGETYFKHGDRTLLNTVYSYDIEEEWFDTGEYRDPKEPIIAK